MLKAAVVGLGKMGISHCAILGAHPDVDLVAVCDSSSFVLEALRRYTQIATYSSYIRMLHERQLDFVVIATPTKYHHEMVSLATNRNMHVFCEKPFSLGVDEGEGMVTAVISKRLVNQVGYHNRFVGTFTEAKRLLDKGILGDIQHFSGEAYGPVVLKPKGATWRSNKAEGGGCLYDYSSHVLNLIDYILGPVATVRGTLLKSYYSADVEDAVYSTLTLATGSTGTLSVNWSDESYRKMSTSITIWGEEGKMIGDAQELKVFLKHDIDNEKLRKGWNIKYITELTAPVGFFLRGEEYSAQLDYFVDHVARQCTDNINSFESALRTDRTIELLIRDAGD